MRVCLVVLAATAACSYPPLADFVLDANTDAPLDAPPTQFGTFIKVRFNSSADVPTRPPTLTADIDTDTSSLCNARNDQPSYCVIAGTTITIPNGMTLRAHGTRPFVLLATGAFDLEGAIDVASRRTQAGPGRPPGTACLGNTAATGRAGGFGGSFGGDGGMGGLPASASASDVAGLPGAAVSLASVLQAGCPGGQGAGNGGGASGNGGSGGGAVAIIAASIHLNGRINASGAGGRGGTENGGGGGGGGGGGSGGMIVLDAPVINAGSGPGIQLYANGGGGGQGGTATGAGQGAGEDGMESPDPGTAAHGGADTNRSGGGGGSAGTSIRNGDPATAAANSGNGGAGGGGTGFIRAPMISGVTYAPAPIVP